MNRRGICLGFTLLVAVGASPAQDVSREQTKLLARRAAEADAYRKLAEIVYGLQINAQTRVRDFVTESDDIRAAVDSFIKGIRLGEPTFYEDGACEIPAEVTVARVIETLRGAHDRHYKGDEIEAADFETISKRIEKNVIRVVGTGAPRPDLPPDLPQGAVEALGPAPSPPARAPLPYLWQKIGPQARMMAVRAARVDALRRLAERIKGLRLTARTQVRDFAAQSDEIDAVLNAHLVGAEEVATYLHSHELIAEVTLRVPTEQVISTIRDLHSRYYDGDDVRGSDIEKVVKTVVRKDFEATGMGVPPPQYIKRYNETAATPVPEWAMGMLESRGQGTDPDFDTPQGRLRAARAAELDAKRKLGEVIDRQKVDPTSAVRDIVTQHEELIARFDGLLANATVAKTEYNDAEKVATVTVTAPGMEVWRAIQEVSRTRSGR